MAHSLSAKKRIRQNAKHRARNRSRKDLIKNEIKGFSAAIASGDVKKATEALNHAASRIDRVAAKGTIHKNAASRKRSRLAKRLNVLKAGGGKSESTAKRAAAKA